MHGPALALNGAQYSQFLFELNRSPANFSQGPLQIQGGFGVAEQSFSRFEAVLQKAGAGIAKCGRACRQHRRRTQDYAVIEDLEMIGGKG